MKRNVLVFIIILIVIVIAGILIIKTNRNVPKNDNQNSKLIYEDTVSPNENFIDKEENKVFYTIKIYQESNNIKVVLGSNSAFSKDISYKIETNNETTENDINVEWQTIMGDTNFTEENQIAVAVVSIYSNGEVISQRKINFISKAIDIIIDTINEN